MPGLITHYICGQRVLAALPPNVARCITEHRKLFNIGCQGPDIFFYYLPGVLKRDLRGIGTKMHKQNVGDFMRAMAEELIQLEDETKDAGFAYFAGYLTHYALDCAAHPYVYYRTGFLREGEKGRKLRYVANHLRFETAIDTLLFKMVAGKKPRDEKLWKLVHVDRGTAKATANFVGKSINQAYDVGIGGKNVYWAMTYMAFMTRLMQSNRGMRKRVLGVGEKIFLREMIGSNLIHLQEIRDGLDYLNEDKALWRDPWDETTEHMESFAELFETAANEAVIFIESLWGYARGDVPIEDFLELVGDRSLSSGRPIAEKVIFRVHDIIFKR
ncbi:MAG: zinc dependent phospholipase C family protein [Clostridiales bacterium]|jgi:hypothetical protein|nr:zinc dependent phospholipase C family protein [Clostridiales bacterium]